MATGDKRRARRMLVALALVCAAPVVASYVAYYWLKPQGRVNYGSLVEAAPVAEINGTALDGAAFRLSAYRGKWILLVADQGPCEQACRRKLYATRQARAMQGREQERVARVWLQSADAPPAETELLVEHPGLIAARIERTRWPDFAAAGDATQSVLLIDPLGNLVLRYPDDPDIKRMAKDLERLLQASRIG